MAWLTLLLTVGVGLWLGAWTNQEWGFLVGGALGYLVAQRWALGAQLEGMTRRLLELESRRGATAEPPAAPRAASVTPAPTAAAPAVSRAAPPEPPATPAPAWPPPPPQSSEPSAFDKAIGEAWAWLKRGNPVAKAGVVILFFGAAFLAKYAADHSMLPLELRLAAIAAGAAALLIVGWRLRETRALYAQILQGGGIAGLYLTVFAASKLYHLVPHGFALPLLIAIATASALLAVAQNALALAVIGFAGGFLAPIMLSTGAGSHVALFSYYAVLNLGVFTVAWFRAWRVLNLVGFVFTFTITGAWRALSYTPADLVSADFFLLLFFVMYVGISVLFALRQKPELKGYVSGSLVFGLPVVVFTLQASLLSKIEYGLAFSALGFGLFYLALSFALFRSRHPNLGLLAEAFAALGVIFGSLAIPLAFDHQTTAAMWAVEGAGLLWIGVRQDRRLARAFGALLQLAGGVGYLIGLPRLVAETPVLNTAFIGTVLLAVSGALSARWLQRARLANYEKGLAAGAMLWATAWFLYGGLAEIDRSLPSDLDYGAALAHGALVLAVLLGLRQLWSWEIPARIAVGFAPLAVLGALAAAGKAHPFAEFGFLAWPLLLVTVYAVLHDLDERADEMTTTLRPALHAGAYAALALVVAWECSWQLGEAVPGVWRQLPWALAPVALLWAANRSAPWPQWPLAHHAGIYRQHASVPLALWIALWVLFTNLSSDGDPGGIAYLPLLNPLDLTSAAALTMLALYVLGLPAERRAALLRERVFVGLCGALVFVWLNAALIRALHHGFDAPLSLHGIRHSLLVQASLSIFWTLLGLSVMVLSTRRGWRTAWMVGAGMMAVVVVKLFLVDLAGSGTIARIASFMSVGLLMLLAGYVSPLPPAAPGKETA